MDSRSGTVPDNLEEWDRSAVRSISHLSSSISHFQLCPNGFPRRWLV